MPAHILTDMRGHMLAYLLADMSAMTQRTRLCLLKYALATSREGLIHVTQLQEQQFSRKHGTRNGQADITEAGTGRLQQPGRLQHGWHMS